MFGIENTRGIKNLNLVGNGKASIQQIIMLRYEFPRSRHMLRVAFCYGLNKIQFVAVHLQCMLRNPSVKRNVAK